MNRHMQQIDHQTGEVVEGDDACSKQFDWQRHESDVGNACTS